VAPIQSYSYEKYVSKCHMSEVVTELIVFSIFSFFSIISFGAPVSNEYRLIVEGQAPISIHTSQVRLVGGGAETLPVLFLMCRPLHITLIMYTMYSNNKVHVRISSNESFVVTVTASVFIADL